MSISQPIFIQWKQQMLYRATISILYDTGGKYCGSSSYLLSYSHFYTILWSPRHWIGVMWDRDDHISTNIHWSFSAGWTTKFGGLFFFAPDLVLTFFSCMFFPFLYYVIYSSCVIMHLIVLECVFVAKFNTILCFYTIFQKPISNTLHMVPYLGKQVSQPCYGHFCHISFFTNLITTDMYNASIMHTIVFLNILKPYFMTFFIFHYLKIRAQTLDHMSQTLHQYLVFSTVNVLVITRNVEICKDKLIKHLNIVVTIRCTIYVSVLMACSLLTYPAFRYNFFPPFIFSFPKKICVTLC